ncbi:isochorismatase family protein [Prevotella sp. KH2C16]|uniref:isochorismatase family protein n=1 Tax=Prevotella sp. KH2C16 TaxID=1855325 RepID=UPI0008F41058|nr:isochorismatase family protein [Prevotella sp. KH2C16]SFG30627.1 nicotinamidase/pyrazinamidase [Prevotella sp. KH2C16]
MNKLLLIIDPQMDFINGSLPVAGAAEAMDALAEYVENHGNEYALRVATSDWHPYHHCSFDREGGPWPVHCLQYSAGAAVWQRLLEALDETEGGFTLLYKGDEASRDEYSILQNRHSSVELRRLISEHAIGQIDVCGLAGNVCVLDTLKDLLAEYGSEMLHVLTAYSPSLDDGSALRDFVKAHGLKD